MAKRNGVAGSLGVAVAIAASVLATEASATNPAGGQCTIDAHCDPGLTCKADPVGENILTRPGKFCQGATPLLIVKGAAAERATAEQPKGESGSDVGETMRDVQGMVDQRTSRGAGN